MESCPYIFPFGLPLLKSESILPLFRYYPAEIINLKNPVVKYGLSFDENELNSVASIIKDVEYRFQINYKRSFYYASYRKSEGRVSFILTHDSLR